MLLKIRIKNAIIFIAMAHYSSQFVYSGGGPKNPLKGT